MWKGSRGRWRKYWKQKKRLHIEKRDTSVKSKKKSGLLLLNAVKGHFLVVSFTITYGHEADRNKSPPSITVRLLVLSQSFYYRKRGEVNQLLAYTGSPCPPCMQ